MWSLAHLLLADYNVYRAQTRHYWDNTAVGHVHGDAPKPWLTKPLQPTKDRIKLFDDMIAWCSARNVEPRLWLHILFKARNWRYPPQCKPGHLMSEAMLPRYRSAKGLGFFARRVLISNQPGDEQPDPNRDLIHVVEALKSRYAQSGQQQRCMEESIIRTNGYHPKSKVCQVCPLAGQCAVQLQSALRFDIQALREGRITVVQAEAQAKKKEGA